MQKIDYKSFNVPKNQQNSLGDFNKKWWMLDSKQLPQALSTIVGFLGQYDSKRQTQYQTSARLYGNSTLMGVNGLSFSKITNAQPTQKDRVSYNVIQSAGDTIVSKMAKNKPKPLFLTSGGDYKLQRKAKKLDKFCDGIFYENNAYKMGPDAFRDGFVFGDGLIYVYDSYGRVTWERALVSELYVDANEAFYGDPRQLHRVRNVDRDMLYEAFPDKKKIIQEANNANADLTARYQSVTDQVTICESWHLPSGPEADDGLHVIIIAGTDGQSGELFREEWTKDYFPFAKFQWCKRLYGNWGQGGAEQIQNIQLEINKVLWVKQRSFHLAGSFKVFIENGSKIVKQHLNNDIGAIVNYSGTPPQYVVPPPIPMGMNEYIDWLKASAYEQIGISQLSANSMKPAGLNSGKALREYNDIESDRFMVLGQQYEDFFLQLARLSIDVAKDIYAEKGEYSVTVPGKKFIETIDWKEIDLEDDQYYMKIFPVSSLPQDPAGRLQTIQEYVQAGFISPRTARKLLNFPDLEQEEELQDAEENYLHKIFEQIIEEEKYTAPNPDDDLNLAQELVLEYIAQGKLNNLEDTKMDMLRQFNDQVKMLVAKSMPPAPPQLVPQANPMAPPASDMIQNVPGGV